MARRAPTYRGARRNFVRRELGISLWRAIGYGTNIVHRVMRWVTFIKDGIKYTERKRVDRIQVVHRSFDLTAEASSSTTS